MSYVDAIKIQDVIHVVERRNGKRIFQRKPAKYVFYVKKKGGPYTSIYGDQLVKFETSSFKTFLKESNAVNPKSRFEHDIDPVTRFLETYYLNDPAPDLHTVFFDIEVGFDPKKGYSRPDDPFSEVTAISVYQSWTEELWCFTIKPQTLTFDEAQKICDKFDHTVLCKTEEELFNRFFNCIDDADLISGWNSNTFDIPYIVKRLEFTSSKEKTKNFCLWNQYPKKRTFEMYGKEQLSYNLVGRVHLDYLDLYKKNTYHEMHSYKLDNVAEYEINEKKVSYDGSLDKLYKEDYELFIKYNRQDSLLLKKIDDKLKFIDLANQLAHDNTVTMIKTLGSVALVEQAINIEIHKQGLIAPSRKKSSGGDKSVAGAYVANPRKGMYDWVGSIDINSLYPSVIRSLNISPETIIGQMKLTRTKDIIQKVLTENKNATLTDAWSKFFAVKEYDMMRDKVGDTITVDLEDGSSVTLSAGEWNDAIFSDDSGLCISANGTIFRTDIEGIIPGLLTRWYGERIKLKAEAKKARKQLSKAEKDNADQDVIKKIKIDISFYDKRQLIKKILLNSLYGALLNVHCRYFDQRMGQSVTLTGRSITKHMIAKTNEIFTGEYNHTGLCSIYGDTDSNYFSAYEILKDSMEWNKENVSELYDNVCEQVNESFPEFMMTSFNTSQKRGEIIQAGREVLATRGIFLRKKRYCLLCYDIEGDRYDKNGKVGKIKALGIEIKRSDTPKVIQDFLSTVMTLVLAGASEDEAFKEVKKFREEFRKWPGYKKGTPKAVNGLTRKVELEKKLGKINMPGHVRASYNWNTLRKMNGDYYSLEITDGAKVIVCILKDNPMGFTSIAYPVDEEHLPEWFKELPFDHESMEEKLIDTKLKNIFGILNWDLRRVESDTTFGDLFILN